MDRLGVPESQRKATLRDAQDEGDLLLDIETRIGELLPSVEEVREIEKKSLKTKKLSMSPAGDVDQNRLLGGRCAASNFSSNSFLCFSLYSSERSAILMPLSRQVLSSKFD